MILFIFMIYDIVYIYNIWYCLYLQYMILFIFIIYHTNQLPFLGYPMYDGFDDSSTFMSKEIAIAFADNYDKPVGLSVLVSAVCCTLVILITLSIYLTIHLYLYLSSHLISCFFVFHYLFLYLSMHMFSTIFM